MLTMKQRGNDPVDEDAKSYLDPDLAVGRNPVQRFVPDPTEDWVHHN